jgi:hypothetical protein
LYLRKPLVYRMFTASLIRKVRNWYSQPIRQDQSLNRVEEAHWSMLCKYSHVQHHHHTKHYQALSTKTPVWNCTEDECHSQSFQWLSGDGRPLKSFHCNVSFE